MSAQGNVAATGCVGVEREIAGCCITSASRIANKPKNTTRGVVRAGGVAEQSIETVGCIVIGVVQIKRSNTGGGVCGTS